MPGGKAKTLTQHETSEAPIGSERPHLEERVLDYFHRNSHAMDSVGGVAQFWVGENHGLVERCLVDLHGRGLLQKRTIAGTDFYSLQQEPRRPTPQQSRPTADSQAQAGGRISTDNALLVNTVQTRNLELKETVARLAAVNDIGKATAGLLNPQELYDALVRMVGQHLKARRVSVLVAEPQSESMSLVASVGITEQEILNRMVRLGDGIAGRVAASQSPLLVTDIEQSEFGQLRSGGRYATSSFISVPLMVPHPVHRQCTPVGVINASDKHSGDPFHEQDLEFLSTLSSQIGVAIEHARLVKDMEDGYLSVLVSLIRTMEDLRPETRGHSRRVAETAILIAQAMGVPQSRIQVLKRAAALHGVGRLLGSSGNGSGKSSNERNGAAAFLATERMLAPIASLRDVREIILRATDWFEAGRSLLEVSHVVIPVESRILALSEEFVRETAGKKRDPETTHEVLERIQAQSGEQHDSAVVKTLYRLVEQRKVS